MFSRLLDHSRASQLLQVPLSNRSIPRPTVKHSRHDVCVALQCSSSAALERRPLNLAQMADEPPRKLQRAEQMAYLAFAELVDTGEISMRSVSEVVILVSVQVRTRCCRRLPCGSYQQQTKKAWSLHTLRPRDTLSACRSCMISGLVLALLQ